MNRVRRRPEFTKVMNITEIKHCPPSPRPSFGRLGSYICILFAILYSIYSWSPLLGASWSIIDDHEFIDNIGSRERLPFGEIPSAVLNTEVGRQGKTTRFRPAYYTLQSLEAAVWGKHPAIWFGMRMAIATLFAALLAKVCIDIGGSILAFGFLVFALSRTYWNDIFARLGPGESYVILGVCFMMLAYFASKKSGWRIPNALTMAIGLVIAVGSKENFVLLGMLPAWWLFSQGRKISIAIRIIFAAVLGYIVWVSVVVTLGIIRIGQTMHAIPVSSGSLFQSLIGAVSRTDVVLWAIVCLSLFAFTRNNSVATSTDSELKKQLQRCLLAIVTLLCIYISQYIFYSGRWPDAGRYDFPGVLAKHLAIFIGFVAIEKLWANYSSKFRNKIYIYRFTVSALFIIFTSLSNTPFDTLRLQNDIADVRRDPSFLDILRRIKSRAIEQVASFNYNMNKNREASLKMVETSSDFSRKINEAKAYLSNHPTANVIFKSHSPNDFEQLISVKRYLRAAGIKNPIAVEVTEDGAANFAKENDPLKSLLGEMIVEMQNTGANGFYPIKALNPSAGCWSFGFNGPPISTCEAGEIIW